MGDNNSINISARTALITGVVTLFLSPAALIIAYYVNHSIARPSTTVVSAIAVPARQIDPAVLAAFTKDAGVIGTFVAAFGGVTQQAQPWITENQGGPDCQAWLHNHGISDERCITPLQNWARGVVDYENVALSQMQADQIPVPAGQTKVQWVQYNSNLRDAAQALMSDLQNQDSKNVRAGDASVYVVISNTGDGDDILLPQAEVVFNQNTVHLTNSGYATVRAHSFQQARYQISGLSTLDDIKAWKELVVYAHGGGPHDFKITVHLGGNRSTVGSGIIQ